MEQRLAPLAPLAREPWLPIIARLLRAPEISELNGHDGKLLLGLGGFFFFFSPPSPYFIFFWSCFSF